MTVSIEVYAIILLLIRVASMTFIFFVLKRQFGLFKLPIKNSDIVDAKALKHFRAVLFFLALIIFIGNILPAVIDISSLLNVSNGRPSLVQPISFAYTLSASITSLLSSYLIWRLYRLAADEKEITDLTAHRLRDEREKK